MRRGAGLFARALDQARASPAMRRAVLAELARPERRWHSLLHHALMLRALAPLTLPPAERRRLTLAVLLHDIVYDATRSDNEERSADAARRWLGGDADADPVAAMILATKRHDLAAADPLTRALLMADLSVLWTPSERLYAFYAAGIRAEYGHVPAPAYRAGRPAVLIGLREQLERQLDPARSGALRRNLAWELAELAAGRFDVPPG